MAVIFYFAGYALVAIGTYALMLSLLLKVRIYQFGMSMLAIGAVVALLSIASM